MLLILVAEWRFMGNPVSTVWDEVTHILCLKWAMSLFFWTMARILDGLLAFGDVSSLCACVLSHSTCVQFFVTYDCSLPGSSVYGMPQGRILEWVVISFSGRSSWPRGQSCVSCITHWATWEACIFPTREQSQKAHCRVSLSLSGRDQN